MDAVLKIVTQLPLQQLWRGSEFITTARGKSLTRADITGLLKTGPVQFVVVDVGVAPRWLELVDCYDFWKTEVKIHVADPASGATLKDFPDGYCYFASLWESEHVAAPIVLLEKQH
jgi:hypothetical protein